MPREFAGAPQFDDVLRSTARVLDCIRVGGSETRQQIGDLVDLGKAVVSERVRALQAAGVVVEEGQLASGGGRPAKRLRFAAELGYVIAVEVAVTHLRISAADLAGVVGWTEHWPYGMSLGPDVVLGELENRLDDLVHDPQRRGDGVLCGIGVGVAAPVEFATGRVVFPPVHPEWHDQPIRDRLSGRYCVPTWVDNEVNLMAQGEFRAGLAKGERDIIFVKLGTGIGAGLISSGRLHRGHLGCAGDIGHVAVAEGSGVICRCGNEGCLEALAGGTALARDARAAAEAGRSPYLAHVLESGANVEAVDVGRAAQNGDGAAVELIVRSGRLIGETLATLVNFFNPSLLILGGGVANLGDLLLAAIRETVYRRSAPLATRELRITRSPLDCEAGLLGGAFMVIDELFSRERLGLWLADGSPVGHPDIAETPAAFASVGS